MYENLEVRPQMRAKVVVDEKTGTVVLGSDVTAREPMGRDKRDHVAAMFAMPRIAGAWVARYGRAPEEEDIDRVYDRVERMAWSFSSFTSRSFLDFSICLMVQRSPRSSFSSSMPRVISSICSSMNRACRSGERGIFSN